jgi:hypothetical protein
VFFSHIVAVIFNQLNIKNKIKKIISEKIIEKNHAEKHCSNQQCFKEKNYKTKISISSILRKISTNIILKSQKIKWENHVGKHRSNP